MTNLHRAAQKIASAKRVAVSTGAGVSSESGVPTFRDALEGLWAQYDPQQLATPAAFHANPKLVWDFYAFRRELVQKTQPNAGHYALAELEKLLPDFTLITQNVDNHHHKAGSQNIITLHGDLFRFKCADNCQGEPTAIDYDVLTDFPDDTPPLCPHCQRGYARPDVVWFGEGLPETNLKRAFEIAKSCDVMLVIGTSGAVYPAAWLPIEAGKNDAFLIEINPNESELSRAMDVRFASPSGEVLPQLVEAVKKELGQ